MTRPLGVTAAKAEAVAATNCTFFFEGFLGALDGWDQGKAFFLRKRVLKCPKWMIDVSYCDEDTMLDTERKNHKLSGRITKKKQPTTPTPPTQDPKIPL